MMIKSNTIIFSGDSFKHSYAQFKSKLEITDENWEIDFSEEDYSDCSEEYIQTGINTTKEPKKKH